VRIYGSDWLKTSVAAKMRGRAARGIFAGELTARSSAYMDDCRGVHLPTGTILIFTRDSGHHTSGWFKNPDYERCLHLSLSFRDPLNIDTVRDFDPELAKEWCRLFFGEARRYAWAESPKSDMGKAHGVWHYRVFCNATWEPILPRGEVYSTEFTAKGWRSWSELHGDQPKPATYATGMHLEE
jgi:hypothetical protein